MRMLKALALEAQLADVGEPAVCLLVGSDESLRAECLRLLKGALAPEALAGSTVRSFEQPVAARDVFDELRTVPFMGMPGRRVAMVADGGPFLQSHWQDLRRYLERPSPTATLLLCVAQLDPKKPPGKPLKEKEAETGRKKAWRELLKQIAARGVVVDCSRLKWGEAKGWVRTYAVRTGGKLTAGAANALVEALGPDLLALRNEVDKLCTYAGPGAAVTDRDVDELVARSRSRSAFDLAEAVGRGDVAEALRLGSRLLLQGESREGIVAVLALQLRRLWQIKRLQGSGMGEQELARQVRAPAFAVRRALKTVGGMPEDRFGRQFDLLARADTESKSAGLRAQEEGVWLDSLLVRLCRA